MLIKESATQTLLEQNLAGLKWFEAFEKESLEYY